MPSGWTPLELLSHVLHMEQRWFVWGFLGEQVDEPWGDWTVDEPWDEDDGPALAGRSPTTSPPRSWRSGWSVGERTDADAGRARPRRGAAVAAAGASPTIPPTWSGSASTCWQEYARHAGHLDIVVELAGG